jgi:hypothetical protein
MPLPRVVERDTLVDEALAMVNEQPQIEFGAVKLRRFGDGVVATDDRMIPPPAQRAMSEPAGSTVVEAARSHSIYVSQPHATAELIKQATRTLVETPASV